jgi:8-oxo-dGTP diphosphatase
MDSIYETIDGASLRRKVRAIIVNELHQVLLIQPHQYKDGNWTFVGGGVEAGESSMDAVMREIQEEVGLSRFVSIQQFSKRHIFKYTAADKLKRGVDYDGQLADIFWVCVPSDSRIVLQTEEVKNSIWVAMTDVQRFVKVPAQLNLFEEVVQEFQPGLKNKTAS